MEQARFDFEFKIAGPDATETLNTEFEGVEWKDV